MAYEALLSRFTQLCSDVFGDALTGVYLHGSMAMGCFHPQKSDIDWIVVTETAMTEAQKRIFLREVIALNRQAPSKGLELSVVQRRFCSPFVYPTPYEFHFSPAHLSLAENPAAYIEKLQGTDPDLAAHFTILLRYGRALRGVPIEDVFAPVPARDYIHSIWLDIENAPVDVMDNPMYVTLNLCRVLAYLRDGLVLSKRDGGAWGLQHVAGAHREIIAQALLCYAAQRDEMAVEPLELQAFAAEMLAQIRVAMRRTKSVPLG